MGIFDRIFGKKVDVDARSRRETERRRENMSVYKSTPSDTVADSVSYIIDSYSSGSGSSSASSSSYDSCSSSSDSGSSSCGDSD